MLPWKGTTLLAALLLPVVAAAQGYTLRTPSIGDALREMDRLAALRQSTPRPGEKGPLEQVFVVPERPGQNQVAWYEFEWRTYDIPSPAGGPGGIRLYFYERERSIAERALPSIRASYLRLVDQFHYSPTKRIPYILYSSHREFLATNVFQITEGTLGVTSPENLQMSLPYFGDHERFREVSTHEMVHQFTIQKLNDLARSEGIDSANINLPLWFVEGIAEYYTKNGLDPEADLYLRDLVWNPDPESHYEIIPFAEDRYRGYIPTYKLGQARVTFIAEVYGKERIQGFLESAHLVGNTIGGGDRSFPALVRRVLNESLEQVDARWRTWLKRRYYSEYLKVKQDLPSVRELRDLKGEPDDFDVSADGNLIFFRGLDRERGRVKLYLMDARHPRSAHEVAEDSKPGMESLHPIDHDVLAIGDGILAFAAQRGAGDALYVQKFTHTPPGGGKTPKIKLGAQHRLTVTHPDGRVFIEIADPTFSMDSSHIAFVGMTERGQRDIYIVPATGGVARQVTDDAFAERDLAWGRDGIYCSSDSTDHGRFNLFRIDPATGERTRLTTSAENDRYPRPQADGSVLYTSYASGKPDVYLLDKGTTRRLTDFATGLTSPIASAQARGVYAATFYRGHFRLVEVPKIALLHEEPRPVEAVDAPPLEIPREDIPAVASPRYSGNSARNWRPEAGIVYGGGTTGNVAGRAAMMFSDFLRDRIIYLDLAIYGSWEYTQGIFLYENRAQRLNWVVGGYHFVQQQIDTLDRSLAYYQRDFGTVGTLRYPLDRFQRVEAEFHLGGVQRYCLTDYAVGLTVYCGGIQASRPGSDDWYRRNGGVTPTLGPTFRYGYDTIRLDPYTGPIGGRSLFFELGGGWLPERGATHGFMRADASTTYQIVGRANISFRGAFGSSFAPNERSKSWARTWWLSSADNLRGFYPLDTAYLVGQNFYVANAELQLPLNSLIRFLFFDYVEGVAALDFGGVFNQFHDREQTICADVPPGWTGPVTCATAVVEPGAWSSRTLTGVLGANVLFGPLLLRVHFGHPFDIGGQKTPAQLEHRSWVTNITLGYFFF